jgi:hypothetical protein
VIIRRSFVLLVTWFLANSPAVAQVARDSPAKADTGTAIVTGRLLVAGERESPVRRARVTLESDALAEPRLADSGTDGRYRFDQLPPGTYRVRSEKPGFVTWSFGARHASDPGQPVTLAAGAARTADIALPRGAALDGRVVNQEGDAVANLVVSACRITYGPYGRQVAVIKESRTDDLGRYRIHSLPAGDYIVQAAADPLDALGQRQLPGSSRPPGPARTYYPGTANLSEAERATVTAGRDAAGLDFGLLSVPMAQLTITVLDSGGKAPSTLATRVQRVGAPPGEVRGSLMKNQAMFPAVPAGEFWIMAAATPAPGARPEFALVRTTIAGSDAALTLRTSPALAIPGRVVAADPSTAAPSFAGVQVRSEPVGIELPNPAGSGAPAPTPPAVAQDGTFVLNGVFGPTAFRLTGLPAGWALASVRLGEQDIIDNPLDLTALDSAPEGPLTMVVTDATGELAGLAIDARKQPVPNARVVLYPDDETQWRPASRAIRSVLASADGTFSTSSLLPGRYLLAAVEWMDNGAWLDPDTLRRLRPAAQRIVVEPHGKLSVSVTVGGAR